jgi:hypothetical protein
MAEDAEELLELPQLDWVVAPAASTACRRLEVWGSYEGVYFSVKLLVNMA